MSESSGFFVGSIVKVSDSRFSVIAGKSLIFDAKYNLDSKTAWADNIFVATVQAYGLADYFLLRSLQRHLAADFERTTSPTIERFQLSPTRKDMHSVACNCYCGKELRATIHDFCTAVPHLYTSVVSNECLFEMYIEFGVRSRLAVMQYTDFVDGLKHEPLFAIDLFVTSYRGFNRPVEECEDLSSIECGKVPFRREAHIARTRILS